MAKKRNLPVASICLYGSALEPVSVSRSLGCDPDYAQAKGQLFASESGKRRTAETGIWMLHSDRFCNSSHVSDHINSICDAFRLVSDFRAIHGVELAVLSLAVVSSEQPELLSLPPELLERLATLGLTLKLEAY